MGTKVQFKKREVTDYIVIHCSATRPSMNVGVKEIRMWHKQQGWLDVGYHYIVRRDGTIEEGRPFDVIGSHVAKYNSISIGVCLIGGVPEDNVNGFEANFTDNQMEALGVIVGELRTQYPKAKVVGHHHLDSKKACPSFNVTKWLATGIMETSAKD